ncbi:hypothetical protein ACFYYB_40740 [Streptomyces sp. NPDC002886]|uniref:hypothetical protein n=1 Tax=Streptomyces sp. NPDC002886 TaxID=3364667 RepID=UPI0036A983DC
MRAAATDVAAARGHIRSEGRRAGISFPTVNLRDAAVLATVNNSQTMITTITNTNDNGQTRTITIVTTSHANDPVDVPFTVAVP